MLRLSCENLEQTSEIGIEEKTFSEIKNPPPETDYIEAAMRRLSSENLEQTSKIHGLKSVKNLFYFS